MGSKSKEQQQHLCLVGNVQDSENGMKENRGK